ncbi:MAG TPA: hypothetical protein VF070_33340, partial [Streptosporangiaceae bacterium]
RECRIEVRPEVSGNGMMAGRELPPVAVLRMDRLLTARARQFKKAGVDGDMDTLRVLAFLERFGEADPLADQTRNAPPTPARRQARDSQARDSQDSDSQDGEAGRDGGADEDGDGRSGGDGGPGPGAPGPGSGAPGPGGAAPAGPARGACTCGGAGPGRGPEGGIAARIHLTAPVATLTGMAGRPGVLRGTGPIDPDLVRDLAGEAAGNPATAYDFTLTDADGRPVAHACGRPGPNDHSRDDRSRHKQRHAPDHGPPRLTLIDRGPLGSHGKWRYTHRGREIIFEFEHLAGPCDHRHQAAGHDPGRHLRHLTAVLNPACTHPACRRPEFQCDYDHATAYEHGGITCLCQAGPVCRRDHRDKQRSGWEVEGTGAPGWFQWKTPSGRTYTKGPSIYPT